MSDSYFLDTNIIIYSHTDLEPGKQKKAQEIISGSTTIISTQVLQESANVLVKKLKFSCNDAANIVSEASRNNLVHVNNVQTILSACNIAQKYHFSFYDSLIIAAALKCDCKILFSEDLNNGQVIENSLTIVNPFN